MVADVHTRTIGDVVSLVRGTTYKSALLGQPGPVLLGLGSIQRNGGFRDDSLKTYGGESKTNQLLVPGDLYVSLKDVTQSADLLGAVARVPGAVASGRLTQDTVKLDFVNQEYPRNLVYWVLRTPQYRAYCRGHSTGTTNLGLPREDFLAYQLPAPTSEILSLVETLEALDDRIDNLRQTNATLEAIAAALFKSWFVDFDGIAPQDMQESELGLIPKGWRVEGLGTVCENIRKQARPDDLPSGTPYIGLEHMPRKSIALTEWGVSDGLASGKFWYQANDVLFGKLRPYFHKVGVASHEGVCSTDILVVRANPHWFGFVTMHLSSDAMISYATQLSNGAKMPRTNWSDIANYKAALPSTEVSEEFDGMVRPMMEKIHANIDAITALIELRDTLLPRLISGQLRAKNAEETTA